MNRSRFTGLSRGKITQRGVMNKTETLYSALLDDKIRQGLLVRYWFEPVSLRLSSPVKGQPARYTPDFMTLCHDGRTTFVDVKGSGPDDPASLVRIKCAAELYPLWSFVIAKRQNKAAGGGFAERTV